MADNVLTIAQDLGGVVLLPCPFCGGKPKFGEMNTGVPGMEDCGYAFVECCIVHAHSEESVEDAVEKWNTRAHSAEIAGALAAFQRVRDALDQPDLIGPASHFRSEEEVIQTRVLRTLIRHELNWHTAMQQGGGGGE